MVIELQGEPSLQINISEELRLRYDSNVFLNKAYDLKESAVQLVHKFLQEYLDIGPEFMYKETLAAEIIQENSSVLLDYVATGLVDQGLIESVDLTKLSFEVVKEENNYSVFISN
jgi:hypothetical protein